MQELDWNNLRVVLAVARTGSLTGAARLLQLDQTTAGRRLTALEESVGTILFRRAKSGFVPTEAGIEVIAEAAVVGARLAALAERLRPDRAASEGVVRLLGNGWMLTRLAEKALPELLDAHPLLELRMSNRLPPIGAYAEPSVALWFDTTARAPDQTRPVARIPFHAYRAKAFDPERNDWVIFRDDDAGGPSFTREVQRRLGKHARIRMTATDAGILVAAVRAGVGQGILPSCIGDACAGLVRSEVPVGRIERVLHIHSSPEFAGLARVETVLGWLDGALTRALEATLLE